MTTYDDGMAVRREVLGDDHVDRATGEATDLTHDFQQLITEYAWGAVWTRAGLDRRTRSLITITALVALGHHEELALHLRGAVRNGVGLEEIKETLLHSAVYCGVPAANTAFRIVRRDRRRHTDLLTQRPWLRWISRSDTRTTWRFPGFSSSGHSVGSHQVPTCIQARNPWIPHVRRAPLSVRWGAQRAPPVGARPLLARGGIRAPSRATQPRPGRAAAGRPGPP